MEKNGSKFFVVFYRLMPSDIVTKMIEFDYFRWFFHIKQRHFIEIDMEIIIFSLDIWDLVEYKYIRGSHFIAKKNLCGIFIILA